MLFRAVRVLQSKEWIQLALAILLRVTCDVPYADDRLEVIPFQNLYNSLNDVKWCRQFNLFDCQLIMSRPATGVNCDALWRNDCVRRRKRMSRYKIGRPISYLGVLYEWLGGDVQRSWPRLPRDLDSIEVPLHLTVGTLCPVAVNGLEMSCNPFYPEINRTNPRA